MNEKYSQDIFQGIQKDILDPKYLNKISPSSEEEDEDSDGETNNNNLIFDLRKSRKSSKGPDEDSEDEIERNNLIQEKLLKDIINIIKKEGTLESL